MAITVPPYIDARSLRAYLEEVAKASLTNVGDLGDVTITAAADKELMTYDTSTSAWINRTPTEADLYSVSGTDVALADGGTGASLADPDADRILFWDDDAGAVTWLTPGSGISITTTSLDVADLTVAGDSGSTAMTPGDTLTVAGGTSITTAMSADTLTVNVDDDFLSNAGDVGTGSYDFGGADDFEIPNSDTPTVDTAGQIAIDTAVADYTGMMKYHDGVEELTVIACPTGNMTTTTGHVVAYNATNNEFEMVAQAGSGLSQASQAAIEAETNEDTYVPPDLVKHSPGVAKAWVQYTSVTTTAIVSSYNISSLADNSTGDTTINIATDFSGTDYCVVESSRSTASNLIISQRPDSSTYDATAGAYRTISQTLSAVAADVKDCMVAFFGDQ